MGSIEITLLALFNANANVNQSTGCFARPDAVAVCVDGMTLRETTEYLLARGVSLKRVEVMDVCDSFDVQCIDDVDLGVIATFVNLTDLSLRSLNRIHSLDPLRWFKKLVTIDIADCPYITSFSPLKDIQSLQHITFTALPSCGLGLDCFDIESEENE
jgi:hypothetical protein